MNVITRNLIDPFDASWSTVHRTLGCHGCTYANREKLGYGNCCTHPHGMLVDISLKCIRRVNRLHVASAMA